MNVSLKQLRALVAVVSTGSFTRAAEHLYISQSTLSGLIKELEQSLGLQLINRSTRRLELSDVGRELYPLINKTLQDLDAVLNETKSIKNFQKGIVRVAVPQLLASTLLPPAIAEFQKIYPKINVKLVDTMVENVIAKVFSTEVDFAIGPEREQGADIDNQLFFSLPFMAVLPKNSPLERKKTLCWSDLSDYPFISLRGQFTERLSLELQQAAKDIQPYAEVTFMSTALSMVHANLGVSVCIPYAAPLIERYQLTMRPLCNPVVKRNFYVFQRKGHTLSPVAQGFHDFLENFINQQIGEL